MSQSEYEKIITDILYHSQSEFIKSLMLSAIEEKKLIDEMKALLNKDILKILIFANLIIYIFSLVFFQLHLYPLFVIFICLAVGISFLLIVGYVIAFKIRIETWMDCCDDKDIALINEYLRQHHFQIIQLDEKISKTKKKRNVIRI